MTSESFNNSRLKLFLFGPLMVVDDAGQDYTPRNQKSKAALAMLALAPRGSRSRIWLRDKLWSDRAESQAAASLRQALLDIRKAFGPEYKDLVQTTKYSVSLDLSGISVDALERLQELEDEGPGSFVQEEPVSEHFLEGFDICDPEFENWLTMERRIWEQRYEDLLTKDPGDRAAQAAEFLDFAKPEPPLPPAETTTPTILRQESPGWAIGISCQSTTGAGLPAGAIRLGQKIARHLSDIARISSIQLEAGSLRPSSVDIPVVLRLSEQSYDDGSQLTVDLLQGDTGMTLWSSGQSFSTRELTNRYAPVLNSLMSRVVSELGRHLQAPGRSEDIVFAGQLIESISRIFSLSPADLERADATLAGILKSRPSAHAYAWMAFAKSFQVGQRFSPDTATQIAEAHYHSTRALEANHDDPLILSLAAHIHSYLFSEFDIAASLFERALKSDPEQIIGWDLYAMLHAYAGQPEKAKEMASWAQFLGAHSPTSYYYDTTKCIASTLAGDYSEALRAGEQALAARPRFNSILRYLISANAHLGNFQAVDKLREELEKIEPDFSTEVLKGSGYPGLSTSGGKQFLRGLSLAGLDNSK